MELVAGCYEQVLFGFAVHPEPKASGDPEQKWTPVADFTHHAHTASLSAVAVNSRFVVTGSKDETIHIYDMKKKIDHGALVHHNGTITCLKFYGNRHLISGAEDGLICVWDAKKWECLKSIKAHKGHVTSLSIHPSGKLALSVGTDKTLRTWNLVEGRSAFIKNIKQNAHIVEWSPRGERYVVVILNKIDVYQLDTASVSGTITNGKRISSVTFLSESVLAVAGDEEVVRVFDCDSLVCLSEFKAHENRVKDLFSFETPEHHVIVTASSDGFIKMWKLHEDKKVSPCLLCEVNTNARLTCLGVWLDRATDTRESPPPDAETPPVSKEEPSKSNKKESGDEVQEGERQSKPGTKKCGSTGDGDKPAKGNSLVSAKKRKTVEMLGKKGNSLVTAKKRKMVEMLEKKKRKKKKM
ncbi:p21-activated protein kinase-interacting protein 1 [Camelus dromedarius]|uniref:p21-activated protein kinase-interacting protein 1 n=1 Tax=Camelus dromedarius TaxID=9838 RepID=A0A5N4CRP7_CAMDR|nr:p21-activated protein kinase-interacting protein 1 isoform X1 [Camelus dromedarius]KAB1261518.1 p21-activated protein kinase-interacting protein 1 [Camelus dromedarius]